MSQETKGLCWNWQSKFGTHCPKRPSGYLFEELSAGKVGEHSRELLEQLDVLVDGPFILAQKDLGLRFRGSANQRIIDVPASLKAGAVRLAEAYRN